jgi:hypothetical protein
VVTQVCVVVTHRAAQCLCCNKWTGGRVAWGLTVKHQAVGDSPYFAGESAYLQYKLVPVGKPNCVVWHIVQSGAAAACVP